MILNLLLLKKKLQEIMMYVDARACLRGADVTCGCVFIFTI